MNKWPKDKVDDLLETHKGKSHSETATLLTKKWGIPVTRDSIKNKYNALNQFIDKSNEPEEVVKPNTRADFNRTESDRGNKGSRTYFLTSAVAGCRLDVNFFKSVETFCKARKAKLVVLPMRGANSKDEVYDDSVLEQLSDYFYTEYTFNSNLKAIDLLFSPVQGSLVGLENLAEKTSIVIASSKQNFLTIPVGNVGIPHVLASTGSITCPAYSNNKAGLLGLTNHVTGGLIIEIKDDKIFHLRQVQAGKDGSFFDIDKQYLSNKVIKSIAKGLVLGDIHCGFQSESAMKAWYEVISLTKPDSIVIHDLFDGRSVSHWIEKDMSEKGNRTGVFKFLKSELDNSGEFLRKLTSDFPKVKFIISRSNHDEFLDRYLSSARFVDDPHNYRLALQLAIYQFDGFNPLQKYIEVNFPDVKNIVWLKRDQDYRIEDILVSSHGDEGANGSRGSAQGLSKVYHNCIIGHSHSPKIYNRIYQVGTSTIFDMPYVSGPSSWLHCSCLVFDGASRQLIISIDGEWRVK